MDTTTEIHLHTERASEALNALLRGEVAAVETYEQAIRSFGEAVPPSLLACLDSHQTRVQKLTVRIYDLGGKPNDSSGLWGTFAKLVEGGAALLGHTSALSALEEGEDHGLALYRDKLDDLDAESRRLIESEIMPEQMKTHELVRNMCRAAT